MAAAETTESGKDQELRDLRAEADALRGHISLISDLSRRITASLDLPQVLQEVVEAACELTQARYGALAVFDESGRIQEFFTCGIRPETHQLIGGLPQGTGVLGLLSELQRPVRLADLSSHPKSTGFPLNHPPMKTFLGASIRYGNQVLGNLYLTERDGAERDGEGEFTGQDEDLLVLFCGQAALAIHNARLHQGVEAERTRMNAILSNSPDGIIFIDASSGEIQSNRRAEELMGFPLGPEQGAHWLEGKWLDANGAPIPVEDHPASRALRGEFIAGEEQIIVGGSAPNVPVLCSAAPVRDRMGNIFGAIFQFQDMTSVKQAQKALSDSEARYRSVLDNSPAVIYIKDTEGRYVLINHQYESLFHVTQEQILGKTDYDIFPKGTADAFRANDRKVLESGAPLETEELVPQDDGLHSYVSLKFPFRDTDGAVYAVCGISTDITDRTKAEEEIRAERQRLAVLVDTSPVGVFAVDAATLKVTLVNREAERILGLSWDPEDRLERYEQAAAYRRPDGSLYRNDELPLHRALMKGETTRAEEVRFEFPDGRSIATLVNATPVRSSTGEITAAIAAIQDMSPLEEMEKLRSEFLGIVSHELRTPLTAIKGSVATVLGASKPVDAAEMREFFQIIDEQADRLKDLVDNLLDMTRIEAGSLPVSLEPINLLEVLKDTVADFSRSAGGHEVRLEIPDALPKVKADRNRVAQVLTNLLSNAAKFSPEIAPITIEVEQGDLHLSVHVRDQGRGIAEDKIPYLFKKFSRVHEQSGHRLSGSGLGLAICKGIVEAHGGRIWVDSPGEGLGTAFSFTLPVAAETPSSAVPGAARRDQHLDKVRRPGERTRILVVDAEAQVLRYLQRSLEDAGYEPLVTSDPQDVVSLVELEEPDLVLLDFMLPGTDGLDLLQRIREFSGVPVIFLSSNDSSEDLVKALKMGADDYITKPFSPSELLARIEVALRRRLMPGRIEVRPPFVLGSLRIDFAQRRVTVGEEPVLLTPTEYKVLSELANHAGLVLTHGQLLQRVWGPEYGGETELVRSFIRNLRRKLGDDARNPRYIFTEPQVGYSVPKP